MDLVLQRMAHGEDSSYGIIFLKGKHVCFTIEDEPREVKVKGETRIPKGRYQIKFREVVSPLTKRYRQKFDWFLYHLEITEVPNFTEILIHVGNYESNTDGCVLVNNGAQKVGTEYKGLDSTSCYKDFYKLVSDTLNKGEEVYIDIRDEDCLRLPF